MFLQPSNSDNGSIDETLLWEELLDGKREALDALFRAYYNPLLNYGIKLVPDRESVKDGIQKLFLKLWRKRRFLSKPESIKAYLFVSLRRILMEQVEREKARNRRNKNYVDSLFKESFNIEDHIIANEVEAYKEKALIKAIQKLSPRQKEALYLRFYDGLTNKEVAEVMGITHQSVRNHISEAIQKIKVLVLTAVPFRRTKAPKTYKKVESA